MSTSPAKVGRPSTYTEELGNKLCELVSNGMSRLRACQKLDLDEGTVRSWPKAHPEFSAKYAEAENARAEHYFEHIVTRARTIKDKDDAQVARVEIDAIKWACARLWPQKFADKAQEINTQVNLGLQLVHSVPRPERPESNEVKEIPAISAQIHESRANERT